MDGVVTHYSASYSNNIRFPPSRVGKVAGSEATTTKRWNAIPPNYISHGKNAHVQGELLSKHIVHIVTRFKKKKIAVSKTN
jgi:hypothetical protein